MTNERLAELAGVSLSTLMNLRAGERSAYSEATLWGVCRALGWTTKSIDQIARGGEPQQSESASPTDIVDFGPRLANADKATREAAIAAVKLILDFAEKR